MHEKDARLVSRGGISSNLDINIYLSKSNIKVWARQVDQCYKEIRGFKFYYSFLLPPTLDEKKKHYTDSVSKTMSRKIRRLVADEPVQFEK